MHYAYNPLVASLSALVAVWGCYDALRLMRHALASETRARPVWLAAGALVVGVTIWSMHFTAMLALRMPVPVGYYVPLVAASMLIAIALSGAAFALLSHSVTNAQLFWVAGACMGVAISGMHFTAMAAMRLPAALRYEPTREALAIAISVILPLGGFRRACRPEYLIRDGPAARSVALPTVFLGAGIVGMHYTANSGVHFLLPGPFSAGASGDLVGNPALAIVVVLGTTAMLGMAELGMIIGRREAQLRAVTARVEAAREEERTRIAREIHDELGQALTVLKLDLDQLGKGMARPHEPADKLHGMSRVLDGALGTLRQIAADLRSPVLDQLGLGATIRSVARDFQARSGIVCHVEIEEDGPVDEETATAVYRILQESLTNVARHAHATRVDIALRFASEHLFLEVRDNGRGISDHALAGQRSLGLLGMRERAEHVGGEVVVTGTSSGTTVRVTIPGAAG